MSCVTVPWEGHCVCVGLLGSCFFAIELFWGFLKTKSLLTVCGSNVQYGIVL